jgi:hypothetical protein
MRSAEEALHPVVQIVVKAFLHHFKHSNLFRCCLRVSLFKQQSFLEGLFEIDEGVEKLAGGAGVFDAVQESIFQRFVARYGHEIAGGQLVHVALVAAQERPVLGFESHLIAVEQGVVRTGLADKLYHQRNGIDEHEEQYQDDVRSEGELAPLIPCLEKPVQRERLGEKIATGLRRQTGEPGLLTVGESGDFLLGKFQIANPRVDLLFERGAKLVLLAHKPARLVRFDFLAQRSDSRRFLLLL